MKSTKAISSDLQIPGFPEVVHLKQYDANTRYIKIPVTDGGSSFTLPDNPVFMVGARLPDGSKVLYDKIINASAPIGVLVSVDPVKWTAQGITGATFTKTASGWSKDGSAVDLDDFGISITKGTPATGSNIVVSSENAVSLLSSGIEIGLAPSLSMIAGTGLIELYIGTNDELISSYCAELQIHEAAADPYSAFTSQSVCTIIAQIQAFVQAELTAHPEWTTSVQNKSIGREKLTDELGEKIDRLDEILQQHDPILLPFEMGNVGSNGSDSNSTSKKYIRTKKIAIPTNAAKLYYNNLDDSRLYLRIVLLNGSTVLSSNIRLTGSGMLDVGTADSFRCTVICRNGDDVSTADGRFVSIKVLISQKTISERYISDEKRNTLISYVNMSMFKSIGVIGDSFSSGSLHHPAYDDSGWTSSYELSWCKILGRQIGAAVTNLSLIHI